MKRKRTYLLLLICMLVFATAGCGANKETEPFSAAPGKTLSVVENEADDTENTADDMEEEQTEQIPDDAYILPNSDSEKLTSSDLALLSDEELKLARNEIYARHGRKFDTDYIQEYFDSQSWYSGRIDPDAFDESSLSPTEKYNAKFILEYESSRSDSNAASESSPTNNGSSESDASFAPSSDIDYDSYADQPSSSPDPATAPASGNSGICSFCNGTGRTCIYCSWGECTACNGRRQDICITCSGTGHCSTCGGSGYYYSGVGVMFHKSTCNSCNGLKTCRNCNGLGNITCSYCRGTGICPYCNGSYFCYACGGTGRQ